MSKISIYEVVPVPKLADKLIGTSVGGEIENITYNFTLGELLNLFIPNIPANGLQGVLDIGNTATQNINLFGIITTTNLEVTDTANLFITYLNEETHIVGSVYDSYDFVGTAGAVLTSTGAGVEWVTLPPIFTPNLQQVLTVGNTANIDIILDANIVALDINVDTETVNNNITIDGTITDGYSSLGTSNQVLSSTGTKVKWVNLPAYSAISPLFFNNITGVFSIQKADSTHDGYLSYFDWITFDGKQNAGNYITALTGEATASGPGSASIILNNSSVTSKVLTGLNVTGGSISAADSILTAFGKVQSQLNGLVGGVFFKGSWNALINNPTLTSSLGTQGWYYIVSVAGNTNLNGITDWQVGDWAIFNGATWDKIDNTDLVTSVNGQIGAVSLTTDTIPEGSTNLYYLDSRARAAISLTTIGTSGAATYNNVTGVLNIPAYIGGVISFNSRTGVVVPTEGDYTLTQLGDVTITTPASGQVLKYNGSFWINDTESYVGTVTSVAALTLGTTGTDLSSTVANSTTTPVITLNVPTASATNRGALSSADWTTFNNKQSTITLTTIGTNGAATFIANTLNIPNYSTDLSGYVPYTGATTNVNLGIYSLTAASLIKSGGTSSQFLKADGSVDSSAYIVLGSLSASAPLSYNNTTGVFSISQSGVSTNGYLSSTDWNTFNNKANALSGTTNTVSKFTSASTIGDSNIKDNGSAVSISATAGSFGALQVGNYNGSILMNTTSSSGGLIFQNTSSSNKLWDFSSFGNDINFNESTVGYPVMTLQAGGNVGIKQTNPAYQLDINGTFHNTGVVTLDNLAGSGSRMVIANSSGVLSTQAITTGTVTAVTASSPLASSGGNTPNITIQQSSGSQNGYLSSTDWTTFNNKQAAGNYITSLTGEATGSGPGAASVTLNNASVTGKVLTGINITGGTVVDTDSILTGFGKLQNQVNGLIGGTIYKGTWNASTNTPTLASGVGTKGWYYIVSVAGTTNLDGITDWFVGDWAIFDGTAWQQVDNTDAVVSVNGQTGAVSLTTDNIPEGATNLYFLNSRARAALSFTAGSGAYNSTTGVITIPTNTSQLTNGANFITLASLSGTSPIVYNNTTGNISINQSGTASNGYLSSTDWNTFNGKQNAITLTTTGTSGAATLIGATLNIPQYQPSGTYVTSVIGTSPIVSSGGTTPAISIPVATTSVSGYLSSTDWTTFNNKQSALTNPVTGTGTSGQVAYFNGTSTITSSANYFWDATNNRLGIGTATPANTLDVIRGTAGAMGRGVYESASFSFNGDMKFGLYTSAAAGLGGASLLFGATNFTAAGTYPGFELQFSPSATLASNYIRFNSVGRDATGTVVSATSNILCIFQSANVVVGSGTDSGFRFDVNGTTRITGQLTLGSTITNGTYTYTLPSATGTLALTSALSGYVPTSRTLSINGTTYDLSADRSWTISTNPAARNQQTFTATAGQTTFSIAYTVGQLDVYYNGSKLAPAEFTATNGTSFTLVTACFAGDIVDAIAYITGAGVGGSGTINYLPKFTGATTLGDSAISDDGTTITLNSRALSGTSATFSTSVTAQKIITSNTFNGDPQLGFFTNASTGTSAEAVIYVKNGAGTDEATFIETTGTNFTSTFGFVQDCGIVGTGTSLSGGMSIMVRANADMRFYTNGHTNERMRITNAGSLGLGTASPNRLLTIKNSSDGVNGISFQSYASTSEIGYIKFEQTNDGLDIVNTQASGYGVRVLTNSIERLKIAATGAATFSSNVTAANYIVSNTAGAIFTASGGTAAIYGYINNTSGRFYFGSESSTGGTITTGSTAYYGQIAAQGLQISANTGNNVHLTINTSGNVGIGTTSPTGKLHSYIGDITAGQNPATSGTTPVNAMLNLTNNRGIGMFFGGSYAGNYGQWIQVSDVGNLGVNYPLFLNPNGGNILIGTTTDAGYKLDVNGTGRFYTTVSGNVLTVGTTYASGRNIQIGISDGSILPTAAAYINDNTGVGVYIGDNTAATNGLYVKNGGNVVIGNTTVTNSAGYSKVLNIYDGSSAALGISIPSYDYQFGVESDGALRVRYNGSTRLTIASTGAATFTSPANIGSSAQLTLTTSSGGLYGTSLRLDASALTGGNTWQMFSSAGTAGEGQGKLVFGLVGSSATMTMSGGNVGIGTTIPSGIVNGKGLVIYDTDYPRLILQNSTTGTGTGAYSGLFSISNNLYINNSATTGNLKFAVYSNSDAMTLTSGGVLCVGTTGVLINEISLALSSSGNTSTIKTTTVSGSCILAWNSATSGNNSFIEFGTDGFSVRGSITYNRGAGLLMYNTTSDANLKNIIGDSDLEKSINILNSTKIKEYSWKEDKTNKVQIGVIAQELYETYKGAVSIGSDEKLLGTKDYKSWKVDKTAFTFHLIAGWQKHEQLIQQLLAKIEQLENK